MVLLVFKAVRGRFSLQPALADQLFLCDSFHLPLYGADELIEVDNISISELEALVDYSRDEVHVNFVD